MMELVFTKLNLQASFQSSHSGNLHFSYDDALSTM